MYRSARQLYLVFDVESIGLYGEGFAVGYVVVSNIHKHLESDLLAAPPESAQGDQEGRDWVALNVPKLNYNCDTPSQVRESFWTIWQRWREQGALLCADCAWPVEATFLLQCIADDPARQQDGPYPLIDVASVRLAVGLDPLGTERRIACEIHNNPLGDAHQSARLLLEAINAAVV